MSRYTFRHRKTWLKRRYFKYLDGPGLKEAGGVHFTTDAEREEAEWLGIDFTGRSHVVPPPLHQNQQVLRDAQDSNTVLFLSRLHPKKNVECLLRAWPLVKRTVPTARLMIAGDGDPDYVATLKAKAACLGEKSHISFVGFVAGKEKTDLLSKSSVFVLPSHQENFGVAVLEAISAGLPVVISPHVQLASYITRNQLGQVANTDPESLAASIVQTLNDTSFRAFCRERGPAAVAQDFSLENIGSQLLSMYEAVIEQSRN